LANLSAREYIQSSQRAGKKGVQFPAKSGIIKAKAGNCENEVSVVTKDEIIEQQAHIIAQQQEIIEQLRQEILELKE